MKIKLVTDQEYLPVLMKLLSKAERRIDILSYSFAIGSASGKLTTSSAPYLVAQKLIELKKKFGRKIRIRLFTEGLRETNVRNRVTANELEAVGIEVVYGSTHAKGFCIDEQFLLFGSTNLTNQSIRKNREANLLIDDKSISKEFLRYFKFLWKGGEHGGIKLKLPFLADGDFKDDLINVINKARKSVEFSIYFFNHREIESALVDAHNRGVQVRGFIHQHGSFALSYIRANRATVKRMQSAGLEHVYLSQFSVFYHSKYLVADGREVLLGTGNWLEEDVLIHPQLYLHLSNPKVAKDLVKHLRDQIQHDSQQPF
jgi:phosphatidylserine/phosphatidylglycerophosphate/cardiolipin synthase-like enzyme